MPTDFTADPRVQAIVRNPDLRPRDKAVRLNQLKLPIPSGYHIDEMTGNLVKNSPAWIKFVGPLAIAGGGFALSTIGPAAAASSAAAPSAAATSAPVAAASGGAAAGGTAAASGAAAAAPVVAKTFWEKALPYIISGAGNVVGSVLNQRAASKASQQQQDAAQQGIDLQKQVWSDIQRNQAPFIQTGQGAITRLNGLMGGSPLNLGQPSNSAPVAPNAQPLALNPAESGGWTSMQPNSPIRPATGPQALVRVQAPDGEIRALPPNVAEIAIQKGGRRL